MLERERSTEETRPVRLLGLELLRCGAAFSVLIWHYQNFALLPGQPPILRDQQPFGSALWGLYNFGAFGVHVFWALSGFIFYVVYWNKVATGGVAPRSFFVFRFSRLYPLHFATLILVAIGQFFYAQINGSYFVFGFNDLYHFIMQLFVASEWGFQSGSSFNAPIWSVSAEILIYAVFFVVHRIFGRAAMLPTLIFLVAAGLWAFGIHPAIIKCAFFFFLGGAVAVFSQTTFASQRYNVIGWLAGMTMIGLPLIFLFIAPTGLFIDLVLVVWCPLSIYFLAFHLVIPRPFRGVVTTAGDMTYASYLIHFPIQLGVALVCTTLNVTIPIYQPLFFITFLGVVGVLSVLTFRLFERPAQNMIRQWYALPADRHALSSPK